MIHATLPGFIAGIFVPRAKRSRWANTGALVSQFHIRAHDR